MALITLLEPVKYHPAITVLLSGLILLIFRSIYRIFFHPLSKVPGPLLAKCTSLWLNYHSYVGDECTIIHALHQIYGPILRVGPKDVDIADGEALAPIYADKGGFLKSECYSNFDIDGHASIFSTVPPLHRAPRAKAVVPLFSTTSLRNGNDAIEGCVDRMVSRMQKESVSGKPVNILNLTRSLATDAVSSYLLGNSYGGIQENSQLSASPFVDSFVAVGRFFYLPNQVFMFLEWLLATIMPDPHVDKSMAKVDGFIAKVVESSTKGSENFPGRLLDQGISKHETMAQCKDLMFAGTDSTGMNLATICWNLALHTDKYNILCREVFEHKNHQTDPQSLPYLRGVVREGLRLSMANPTRLPRVVPPSGWTFKGYHFPPGTNVGVAAYELHLSPKVFPSPNSFLPERWLDPTPEMQRDWMPFGAGTRQCIARNLAMVELYLATAKIAERDVMKGASVVEGKVEIMEWFNSKVRGEKIELIWPAGETA
ncbi:MAG: hypothetical protein M1834_009224 [Cirrosporium novae-zelandiae]|nr:MAG: hypothetical protein M1834_009224 [Cirrosporium novae-zelandiae]